MTVTRDDPRTLHELDAELEYISHLLTPDGDRSLSEREKQPLMGRVDHLLDLRPTLQAA